MSFVLSDPDLDDSSIDDLLFELQCLPRTPCGHYHDPERAAVLSFAVLDRVRFWEQVSLSPERRDPQAPHLSELSEEQQIALARSLLRRHHTVARSWRDPRDERLIYRRTRLVSMHVARCKRYGPELQEIARQLALDAIKVRHPLLMDVNAFRRIAIAVLEARDSGYIVPWEVAVAASSLLSILAEADSKARVSE